MAACCLLAIVLLVLLSPASGTDCLGGACGPGNDFCGEAFTDAPAYHLMDQHGCGEVRACQILAIFSYVQATLILHGHQNDPNAPVYDPVHGVVHHFYQVCGLSRHRRI